MLEAGYFVFGTCFVACLGSVFEQVALVELVGPAEPVGPVGPVVVAVASLAALPVFGYNQPKPVAVVLVLTNASFYKDLLDRLLVVVAVGLVVVVLGVAVLVAQ